MSNPTDNAELITNLRNEISASLYGVYYYEMPDNWTDAKSIVERAAKVAATHIDTVCREAVYNELYNHVDADAKYYPEVLSSDHITVLERLTQLNPNKDTPNE